MPETIGPTWCEWSELQYNPAREITVMIRGTGASLPALFNPSDGLVIAYDARQTCILYAHALTTTETMYALAFVSSFAKLH